MAARRTRVIGMHAESFFALSNPDHGQNVYSYWDGEKWTMSVHKTNWRPGIELPSRINQSAVIWRPIELK